MKKIVLLIIAIVSCLQDLFAQTPQDFISLRNFRPPSPESAAMAKYGDIPVDLSTGVINIDVPVYEIKSRQLALPISLSYHASGIKVADLATPVGLGWVLNAGGSVSRTVVGQRDEGGIAFMPAFYYNKQYYENVLYHPSNYHFSYLAGFSSGNWDYQSDKYNFNIPGLSGKFVYDTASALHYFPVDRQLQISRIAASNSYKIIDDSGILYEFSDGEKTEATAADTTTWHLTRMISADRKDTIAFEYIAGQTFSDFEFSNTFYVNVNRNTEEFCQVTDANFDHTIDINYYVYYRKLLDKITFAGGYVKFIYIADRQDPIPERLYKIKIFGSDDSLIRQVQLNQGYFESGSGLTGADSIYDKRLRLDKVEFQTSDSITQQEYSFVYRFSGLPAYRTAASPGKPVSIDYWGYYNGQGAGTLPTLLPQSAENNLAGFLASQYGISGHSGVTNAYALRKINRYAEPNNMAGCMLDTVYYPTGGFSTFEYETNKVRNNGNNTDYVGGLRIKKVTTHDFTTGLSHTKAYSYSLGKALNWQLPHNFDFTKQMFFPVYGGTAFCQGASFFITANPISPINYHNGSPVIYDTVTVYHGTTESNLGKIEYIYDTEGDSAYGSPYLRKYWNFSTDKSWARGQILTEKTYKNNAGNYELVRLLQNVYEKKGTKTVKIGQLCEQISGTSVSNLEYYLNVLYANSIGTNRLLLDHFDYEDVALQFGIKKLIKTEVTDFLNDTITKKKEFLYNGNGHLYTSKIYEFGSVNDDTLITTLKYPQDKTTMLSLGYAAAEALDSLVARNIKTPLIESVYYRNGNLLSADRTDYGIYNEGHCYPYALSQLNHPFWFENRIVYNEYDNRGNVTRMKKSNGHDIVYIWDYDSLLAVGEVINAGPSDIAFSSFEGSNQGNWSHSSAIVSDNTAPTGLKCLYLNNASITVDDLNQSKKYKISYWVKSGSSVAISGYPVNQATGPTIKGWTYHEAEITNTTQIEIAGSGYIDEARVYPVEALITSFTYRPLVGVTSKCDSRNHITYYEYDEFGRLKAVRDMNGNILKRMEYKFKAGNDE